MPKTVPLNPKLYRKGAETAERQARFVFHGGIGDMICYLRAIEWIAEQQPHVKGELYVPPFMLALTKHFMVRHQHWEVFDKGHFEPAEQRPTYASSNGPPINAAGGSLLRLGFAFFTNRIEIPKGYDTHPRFKSLPAFDSGLNKPYVVMTPGASVATRAMPPPTFNALKAWIMEQGYEVVLLGKEQITEKRKIHFMPEYDFSNTINFVNKTTLLEAASICENAAAVVGIDNGILHLAAMTKAPIVFGYTVASPEFRFPLRHDAKTVNVTPPENLSCRYCQDNMRFLFNHGFDDCAFSDFLCLQSMTPDVWIAALKSILDDSESEPLP